MQGALAASSAYLLVLLLAARRQTKEPELFANSDPRARSRLLILIPAHNEQDGIDATLAALGRCDYPPESRETVVIADNCTDQTAQRARRAGAGVWERREPALRGKGQALIWALKRSRMSGAGFDGVVVLDADCLASSNLLAAIDQRLRAGASAVQVNYTVANPQASTTAALRFGAFGLMNTVRYLGKARLGLSCGLAGTGMAFSKSLLERQPWTSVGLSEDGEYHMRLVLAGERVEFAANASVSSAMPTTLRGSSTQQARWEQGRLQLIRHWSPRLLLCGARQADPVQINAGLECLVAPQSLITAGSALSMLGAPILGWRRLAALGALTLAAQCAFVLGGLRLIRAPAQVYRALPAAPALIASKVALYARLARGRGPRAWTPTEREAPPTVGLTR